MVGGIVGNFAGFGLGYRTALDWRRLEFFSEGLWAIDIRERSNSFLYSWSEVSLSPADWLRVGLVAQRTQVFKSERDIDPGLLLGLNYRSFGVTANVFNPDTGKAVYVISVGLEF